MFLKSPVEYFVWFLTTNKSPAHLKTVVRNPHCKVGACPFTMWSYGIPFFITFEPSQKLSYHDDVIKWKHFPRYWKYVRGIHRSPVNSPHKGRWRGALIFFFDLHSNKRLSKQWWGWWFETLLCPLWRHCNEINQLAHLYKKLTILCSDDFTRVFHHFRIISVYIANYENFCAVYTICFIITCCAKSLKKCVSCHMLWQSDILENRLYLGIFIFIKPISHYWWCWNSNAQDHIN